MASMNMAGPLSIHTETNRYHGSPCCQPDVTVERTVSCNNKTTEQDIAVMRNVIFYNSFAMFASGSPIVRSFGFEEAAFSLFGKASETDIAFAPT